MLVQRLCVEEAKKPLKPAAILNSQSRSIREFTRTWLLSVSSNGGLDQMGYAICDMVAIARYLNVALIVPELDKTSFWSDPSG
ncbi:hypothetical protein L6452_13426 [Arctium lappa]|uniref:Uncharacterized protein n=1 Tax=Arctium lappa TaxID=4217 RepID=A0ACB9CI33_ARCLA|nr:hypothetical protein L6452_13426 [Arctium lappa]